MMECDWFVWKIVAAAANTSSKTWMINLCGARVDGERGASKNESEEKVKRA